MEYTKIFERLWSDYIGYNTDVKKIYDLFVAEGEEIVNDHIAFRTFNDSRINISILADIFLINGYEKKGEYVFENKHLFAKHYEHKTDLMAPRVFISELILEDFSPDLQHIIKSEINCADRNVLLSDELIYAGNIWSIPTYENYQKLKNESEYAAWVYVFGFRANHFTVSVNYLKKYDSIQKVNAFLKQNGFLINDVEGEIKGTPEEFLEQSSIKSGIVKVQFLEGEFEIPSCYYEFAKRYNDNCGKLFSGFIAKSADKIFESTDFYKKKST